MLSLCLPYSLSLFVCVNVMEKENIFPLYEHSEGEENYRFLPTLPLPDLQCHLIEKHSAEWCTTYHLSYPEGDSINEHMLKDPFQLQYVLYIQYIQI